jgi:hypothetical protein
MAEEFESMEQGKSMTWSEVWIKAVTEPSEEAYREIMEDPGASPRKANTWVFLASLVGMVIGALLDGLFGTSLLGSNYSLGFAGLIGTMICVGPIVGALAVLSLAISSGIIQAIAKALGGEGNRNELVFGMAAYLAPLSLVSSIMSGIPVLKYLGWLLSLYGLVLNVIAVKAANKFDWGKAVAASLGILVVLAFVAGFVILVLALLGPAIGNVYNSIQ